jgi:hypothetical protein
MADFTIDGFEVEVEVIGDAYAFTLTEVGNVSEATGFPFAYQYDTDSDEVDFFDADRNEARRMSEGDIPAHVISAIDEILSAVFDCNRAGYDLRDAIAAGLVHF